MEFKVIKKAGKGMDLYHINGIRYCQMIDVLQMLDHARKVTTSIEVHDIIDRMKYHVMYNDLCKPSGRYMGYTVRETRPSHRIHVPGRYALGYYDENGWKFYAGTVEGQTMYTARPCEAYLYENYRDAEAARDFIGADLTVLDWVKNMSSEDLLTRSMYAEADADKGNKNSLGVMFNN